MFLGGVHQRIVDGSKRRNLAFEIFGVEQFPAYYRPICENGVTDFNFCVNIDCLREGHVQSLQKNSVLTNVFERSELVRFAGSQILTLNNEASLIDLLNLEITSTRLIYQGSRDGFGTSDFHRHCDGKGKTLSVIQVGDFIFRTY